MTKSYIIRPVRDITPKRSVHDIPIVLDEAFWNELYALLNAELKYKVNRENLVLRDKALISLLIMSGCRISEALSLKKIQFRFYHDRILLMNVISLKNGDIRPRIQLPKTGKFAPFTLVLGEWLNKVPDEECYVFPPAQGLNGRFKWNKKLSRKRAHYIIKSTTNKFPHWFRGVCENIYGRIIFENDAWGLQQFMGIKRLDSTTPYIQSSWEKKTEKIFEL